jgi:hypothetical protein
MRRASFFFAFVIVAWMPLIAFAQKPRGKPTAKPPATAPESVAPQGNEPAAPSPTAPSRDEASARKDEARLRFDRGMQHFDRKIWDAALAEFLASRQNYPTRGNTQNAAICLKNLNRFDEALEMFEALVKEFPNLPDRALVDREIFELKKLVGSIDVKASEPGANVVVDGRDRGVTQLEAPIRVTVGTHTVQIYKEGLKPFETRVEVAGGRSVVVEAKLEALGQSGRLTVVEESGKPAEVVIDNVAVGRAPWQGPFAVGDHTVFLRGDGHLGTQPAVATVKINQVTKLTLALEPLEGRLRVEPTPLSAVVAIDGVTVGNGLWDGRLRAGTHKVEVAAEGFLPQQHDVTLAEGATARQQFTLERDPSSPLWASKMPSKLLFELVGAPGFGIVGGDLNAACTSSCSGSVPFGFAATFHAGYELRSGLGFALDIGYLMLAQKLEARPSILRPVGKPDNPGSADDEIAVRGPTLGAAAFLRFGKKMPITTRLGLGALVGSATDRRTGTYHPNDVAQSYPVGAVRESPSATYFYVAPEVRLGLRLDEHFEVFAGLRALVLVGLQDPRWRNETPVVAGAGQGLARFQDQSIVGKTAFMLAPGVGLRADF